MRTVTASSRSDAARRRGLGAARDRGRRVPVAAAVQRARRRVRPALRPEARAPRRARRDRLRERHAATRTRRRATGTSSERAFEPTTSVEPGRRRAHPQAGLLAGHRRRGRGGARVGALRRERGGRIAASAERAADRRLGTPHRAAWRSPTSSRTAQRVAVRLPAGARRDHRRVRARRHRRRGRHRRDRDPRLLHDHRTTWRSTTSA